MGGWANSGWGKFFTNQQLGYNFTSGIIRGGIVTINSGDSTKFDVAKGFGIVMNYTDEENIFPVFVNFGPFEAQSIPDITEPFSLVFIDINGAVSATSGSIEDGEDRRTKIPLQGLTHVAGTVIETVTNRSLPAVDFAKTLCDVLIELPPANIGNDFLTNGANLQIQKTAGKTFSPHVNYRNDILNPSRFIDDATSPQFWIRHYMDGSGGFTFEPVFNVVDPNFYDDGTGTLAAMDPNKFQTQLLYWVPESGFGVSVYGQTVYNSLALAQLDIPYQTIEIEETLRATTSLRAILIMRTGTTSLENVADAFLVQNRFNFSNR